MLFIIKILRCIATFIRRRSTDLHFCDNFFICYVNEFYLI